MKIFILIAMFLVGCKQSTTVETPPPKVETPVEIPSSKKPYLTVEKCTNCTDEEWEFIKQAIVKTNETVETTCFQSLMLKRELIQTLGRTNEQVVKSLVGADVKIDVEMYYTLKRVLGYTYEGVNMEWINRRYMLSWNKCDLASLLSHETSHKIGYDHDYYYSDARNYSVPYSINVAIEECCVWR